MGGLNDFIIDKYNKNKEAIIISRMNSIKKYYSLILRVKKIIYTNKVLFIIQNKKNKAEKNLNIIKQYLNLLVTKLSGKNHIFYC
jgi:hypothetical protein